ncbi:MAG: DUF3501 family protein [Alphaproteobacteria bacterium]
MTGKREITEADLLPVEVFARERDARRKALAEIKKNRRVGVGPFANFYFENYHTMWWQVQEMLYIEKGGAAQIADELAVYNPLIPKGRELVATLMFEIDERERRNRELARLGGVENSVGFTLDGETIRAEPTDDIERSTPEGRASSVHFLRFSFTEEQVAKFKDTSVKLALEISHPHYGHSALIPEPVRWALSEDFD